MLVCSMLPFQASDIPLQSMLYVRDVAEGLIALMDSDISQPYDLTAKHSHTTQDIIKLIQHAASMYCICCM